MNIILKKKAQNWNLRIKLKRIVASVSVSVLSKSY